MSSFTILHEIELPSTSIDKEAQLYFRGVMPVITYGYWKGNSFVTSGIGFDRIFASRWTGERYCKVWHLDAYDTLIEVNQSEWINELRKDVHEDIRYEDEIHHYMIYFSSTGCFEICADSWWVLPLEIKTL